MTVVVFAQDPTAESDCLDCPTDENGDEAAYCRKQYVTVLNGFWRHQPKDGTQSVKIRTCPDPRWCTSTADDDEVIVDDDGVVPDRSHSAPYHCAKKAYDEASD